MNPQKKFKLKNIKNIDTLNDYIDNNTDNIQAILASPEMYEWLKEFKECDIISENIIHYKGKLVHRMYYFLANKLNFVFKDSYIKFDLPCICGIYGDEKHP